MTDDHDEELPAQSLALAAEMRRLGHAMLGRTLAPERAEAMVAQLAAFADEIEAVPERSKAENLGRRNRINTFLDTGRWPGPPADRTRLEFDPSSLVGGQLNPFSMEARYYKDGDEVEGLVRLGPCFEGPPERVHGGVICAIFDEVMGSVFRATGTASAFTGELTVRFVGAAPLASDLVFRARLVGSEGRRRLLEGEASGPDGEFARATATFVEMKPEHFIVAE